MSDTHKSLQVYLQKLLSLQDKLTPQDLKSLALEMGFSEEEWKNLQDSADDHLKRGRGFLRFENWEDAIEELEQAYAINPLNVEILDGLAEAYQQKWLLFKKKEDKQKAILFAEKALDENPEHEQSLARISQLRNQTKSTLLASGGQRKVARIAVVLTLMLGSGIFLWWQNRSETPEIAENTPVLAPASDHPRTEATNAANATKATWMPHPQAQSFEWIPIITQLNAYQESFGFELRGMLKVKDLEVHKVRVRVELFDLSLNLVLADTILVLDDHQPIHRKGDAIPLGWDAFRRTDAPRGIAEVHLTLVDLIAYPGADSYATSPRKEFSWEQIQPTNVELELRERFSDVSVYSTGTYGEYTWEVLNAGKVSLSSLKFEIQWLDPHGEVADTRDVYAVSVSDPPIQLGETRLFGGTYGVKKLEKVGPYRLVVKEVDL